MVVFDKFTLSIKRFDERRIFKRDKYSFSVLEGIFFISVPPLKLTCNIFCSFWMENMKWKIGVNMSSICRFCMGTSHRSTCLTISLCLERDNCISVFPLVVLAGWDQSESHLINWAWPGNTSRGACWQPQSAASQPGMLTLCVVVCFPPRFLCSPHC